MSRMRRIDADSFFRVCCGGVSSRMGAVGQRLEKRVDANRRGSCSVSASKGSTSSKDRNAPRGDRDPRTARLESYASRFARSAVSAKTPRQKPFVEGQYLIPLITARVSKGHGSDISSEERALTVPRSVVGPVLANRDLLLFPDCLLIVPICH